MVRIVIAAALLACWLRQTAKAAQVGEAHRVTTESTAALRDAQHRDQLRVTIWYPAAAEAVEQPLVIGPARRPLFDIGSVAADAPFAPGRPHPVLLLSHGFGGSARIMGWFGIAMARAGYVVIAVDHPGNNSLDKLTFEAAVIPWDRADDLRSALLAVSADPVIGPHLDLTRVGVAGYSAGGYTALVAIGARPDPGHFAAFCAAHATDGMCSPPPELKITPADIARAQAVPEVAAEIASAGTGHAIPAIMAAFVIAPALVQMLDPASLPGLRQKVSVLLGEDDRLATPETNGLAVARAIPGAAVEVVPGVGHYDFLARCTDDGRRFVPLCRISAPQADTHRRAIDSAVAFFARTLGDGEGDCRRPAPTSGPGPAALQATRCLRQP